MRQPRQPLARQGVDARGRELAADRLQPLRVGAAEQAVVECLEGDALPPQLALDVLVPVEAQLGVVGEVGAELDEQRAEVLVAHVEVVGVGHGGRGDQAGGAETRDRVGAGLGAQHARLLPSLADVEHALAAGPLAQVLLRAVVLALALAEADQVEAPLAGEALDRRHEVARQWEPSGQRRARGCRARRGRTRRPRPGSAAAAGRG